MYPPNLLTTPGKFVVGCNYWASHAGTNMWRDWQPEVVDADLRQLAEAGLQVLRVFPLWPDFQPITLLRGGSGAPFEIRLGEDPLPDDETGQAGMDPVMLERFTAFADLAQRHGLRLVVGLLTGWMSGRLYVPPALEGLNVLTDPLAIQWEVRFVSAFVRRFRQHPALLAWDLGNECNVMAQVPSQAAAWAWVSAITNAIRVQDPQRVIVSGMHGSGVLDTWPPALLGEHTDLLTTHPYPYWTPYCDQDPVTTIRTLLHSTAESRLYADLGGKPCLAEEIGTLGPMMASDVTAADFVRSCLFSLWAHDCHGLLWWCAYDQDHLSHAPYDWNTCERELGLIRADRTPKPVLAELDAFRAFVAGLPFDHLPAQPREAICLLPVGQDPWEIGYSAFVLARQAGFALEFQDANAPLREASLYLLPSARGILVMSRRRWLALLERVRAGASLYISLDTALLPNVDEVLGVEVLGREKRSAPDAIDLPGVGALPFGGGYRLNMQPGAETEVLARGAAGLPVFTRHAFGQGSVYLLGAPLEVYLTSTPGVFHQPGAAGYWQIYALVAEGCFPQQAIRKQHPLLAVTEHAQSENERVIVAINYSPSRQQTSLQARAGWRLGQVLYGKIDEQFVLDLPANQSAVFTIRR